jgi:ABC-type transport system involved in Fe-S cluster assembly fused permease/ATPase subunit
LALKFDFPHLPVAAERQRLAIAPAMLKDASIARLDRAAGASDKAGRA